MAYIGDYYTAFNVEMKDEPTGSITITQNGTYDVKEKASAIVNTPTPSGSINITENGTYDVSQKASAIVNTPTPTGSITITDNGTYDVSQKASANVNVPKGDFDIFHIGEQMSVLYPVAEIVNVEGDE